MPQGSTLSTEVGLKLLEISVLVLPIWLAALRYILNKSESGDIGWEKIVRYSLTAVLGYAVLLAAIISPATYLVDQVNQKIGVGLLFLQAFAIIVGAGGVNRLIDELADSEQEMNEEWVWKRLEITQGWVIWFMHILVYSLGFLFLVLIFLAFIMEL